MSSVRERVGAGLLTIGTVLVIVGSLAPWATSLGIDANSWDLRSIALDLGFSDNGAFEIAVFAWAIVPISLVAAAGLAWWGRSLLSVIFGVVGALYGGIVAFAVLQAPDIDLFDVEWGVPTVLVGSLVVLVGAVVQIVVTMTGGPSDSAAVG